MVLRSINSVPTGVLAYAAICELVGLGGGDIRGLSLELGCDEDRIGQLAPAPAVSWNGRQLWQCQQLQQLIDRYGVRGPCA
jgi:hypothetical protein